MSVVGVEDSNLVADASAHVSELTGAKIRTFLFEVAEGVSNYRSLHSLTQQVEHQYHGRFLIELVQNAHDAFAGSPAPGHPNRIEIVLDSEDSEYGSLLVANDGEPFTSSNFERLSQLGQSDKDPQKSIGNKGIGFRSVLEVSERPEVYSRSSSASATFDGYCFAFRPEVVQSLVEPMMALASERPIPISPVSDSPIVDWSEDLLRKFRKRVRANGVHWLTGECKYLSPYLLPVPLVEIQSSAVRALEAQGFATVVRLPLKSAALRGHVLHHMEQLSSSTVLFLDKVSSLTLRVLGEKEQAFERSSSELAGASAGTQVTIHDSANGSRRYAVWSRELHVASTSPAFRAAVSALPGRWPEIEDLSVSIAVRLGDVPEPGRFSIYLPTLVATGSAVHVNAPYWAAYKRVVEGETRPPFASLLPYAVGSLYVFPGIAEAHSLSESARNALCELVLQSLPQWPIGLAPLAINKQGGQADRRQVTSPLRYFLQSRPWLAVRDIKGISWARPSERWHVPADAIAGRARHFAHLKALPSALARRLDIHEPLANILHDLGMPHFDLHTDTASPRLLEALTASIGSEDVPDANVLLGQLRDAWHRFRPPPNLPALAHVVVRSQDKQLVAVAPTAELPVFLPDYGSFVSELEQFGLPVLTIYPDDAKNLKEWFASAYGPRVQLTSKLDLVPQVNGAPWTGVSAVPLADSELGWLIRPLLALVAFYGQLRGIHSAAFQERLDLLRQTRIDWVPNAAVAVMRDNAVLMTSSVPALWDADRKTIIATDACRANPTDLSVALSQALRRDDLELPLRVVLSRLESVEDEPEDVSGLLSQLRISAEQVQQVIEHLRGDVGHMGRLLQMLAAVLAPEVEDSAFLEAKTEDELVAAIAAAGIPGLDPQRAVRVARESQDMFDFGRSMWRELGAQAALSRWNATLEALGESRLGNRSWSTQLQAGMEEAAGLIKRLMAHLIREGSTASFASMLSTYEALPQTVDLSGSHWDVDFSACMGIVADLVQSWHGGDGLCVAIRAAVSAEDLRERLDALGVRLDLDPDECSRRNHQLVEAVAGGVERLRLAWWLKSGANDRYGEWRGDTEGYRAAAAGRLESLAFTQIWSEADVFDLLRSSGQHAKYPDFWAAVGTSTDLASLQAALQVSNDDLAGVEARLAAMRAESQRLRNVVKICGEDFDGSEENRKQLWTFLQDRVAYESLAATQPLDLGKSTALLPVKPPKGKDVRKNPPQPNNKQPRQTKAVDELVGLAGEIFVYQMLQQRYGSDVVSSSSWVSENSKYVFPHNQADDGRGCDFAFTVKAKLHRIEVKSSSGDDESFTLGSSEISLAMELASKKRGRRELFMLVHVKNALSAAPQAVVLPNPYESKSAGLFSIEKADARVRYRPKR